jgi:N-acetyl-anhydromuramyl-L-alanine amidase AmpD
MKKINTNNIKKKKKLNDLEIIQLLHNHGYDMSDELLTDSINSIVSVFDFEKMCFDTPY